MSFDAPEGGADYYMITYENSTTGSNMNASGSPHTVKNLIPGSTYTFYVQSQNSKGLSVVSESRTITTGINEYQ